MEAAGLMASAIAPLTKLPASTATQVAPPSRLRKSPPQALGSWAWPAEGASAMQTIASPLERTVRLAAEVAIIATDIAEVIGTAIGLNLLFSIPLEIGVLLTALDVFLILYLQKLGFRYLEAFIITLLAVITACFAIQIALANQELGPLIRGFAPTTEIVRNPEMLYLAMGILGAPVESHGGARRAQRRAPRPLPFTDRRQRVRRA